jgi:hypothetical protein
MPIANRSRSVRAIPIGIDPRDSNAADGHDGSAGGPRADVGAQESQLAAVLEFERLAEQKKQREDDHEHVADKLQGRWPNLNQFSQNGVLGMDSNNEIKLSLHEWEFGEAQQKFAQSVKEQGTDALRRALEKEDEGRVLPVGSTGNQINVARKLTHGTDKIITILLAEHHFRE